MNYILIISWRGLTNQNLASYLKHHILIHREWSEVHDTFQAVDMTGQLSACGECEPMIISLNCSNSLGQSHLLGNALRSSGCSLFIISSRMFLCWSSFPSDLCIILLRHTGLFTHFSGEAHTVSPRVLKPTVVS